MTVRNAMPLMNSAYPEGKCREYIETIPDEDERAIALGEYYYYSDQPELAAETMVPYLDSTDPALRYSAGLVVFFASFARGNIHQAMRTFEQLPADLQKDLRTESGPLLHAVSVFAVTACSVLLHMPVSCDDDLQKYLPDLPDGMKLWI